MLPITNIFCSNNNYRDELSCACTSNASRNHHSLENYTNHTAISSYILYYFRWIMMELNCFIVHVNVPTNVSICAWNPCVWAQHAFQRWRQMATASSFNFESELIGRLIGADELIIYRINWRHSLIDRNPTITMDFHCVWQPSSGQQPGEQYYTDSTWWNVCPEMQYTKPIRIEHDIPKMYQIYCIFQ